jgi:enoyl-CoA hydratase/carnithine racemase
MTATGRFVPADEALRIGLANRVVPHEELAAVTRDIALAIRGADQPAVRASYGLYDRSDGASLAQALHVELEVASKWIVDTSEFGKR